MRRLFAAVLPVVAVVLVGACGVEPVDEEPPRVAPRLSSFSASPPTLVAGVPTEVTWEWSYAEAPSPAAQCTVDGGVGAVSSGGSTTLTLGESTEYTLSCTNEAGSDTRRFTLEVTAATVAPVIATFTAAPQSVVEGVATEVTWSWTFVGEPSPAPSCEIDNGVGSVASGDATTVTLTADATFTLSCVNPGGADTATAELTTTTAPVAPQLESLTATPALLPADTASDVAWTWTYANSPTPAPTCTIDQGVGEVTSGAVTSVSISADTTFTLTCSNEAGSDTAQVVIEAAIAPQVADFVANPSVVTEGVATQVIWTWTYANSPSPEPSCTVDMGVGSIASGGSTTVTLTADTEFTLTCTNEGGTATAKRVVQVTAPQPPMPCPPVVNGDMAPDSNGNCPSYTGSNVVSLCTCGGVSGAPADQAALSCNPGAHTDRMYCWRAPTTDTYRFALSPGSDLALGVFSADSSCGELACSAASSNSFVDVPMQVGQQVYIVMEETSGNRSFTLAINAL